MKKKYYIIGSITLVLIVTVIIIFLSINKSSTSKNIIGTSLNKEMEVVNNIYIKDDMILNEDNSQTYYFEYKDNKLVYDKLINRESNLKYTLKEKYDGVYYLINNQTKKESFEFINYIEIKNEKDILYYILKTEERIHILNVSTDKIIDLDKKIIDFGNIFNMDDELISDKYLVAKNDEKKYGIIDYSGKIIIDFKYDALDINKENFIFRSNNKVGVVDNTGKILIENKYDMLFAYKDKYLSILNGKYGIIDNNGKQILEHKYNMATKRLDHIALEIDGKIGIFTDKLILEPTIELSDKTKLSSYIFNNNIHIITNDKTYVINNGKIIKTIDKKLYTVLIDGKEGVYSNKYLYSRETNGMKSKFEIYDTNYNMHYSFEISEEANNNYIMSSNISTTSEKKYSVNITLNPQIDNLERINKTYAYDFDNKKEITSDNMEKSELENGLKYTIDAKNVLKIYKEDKVIGEYENILYFIDNYYFISTEGIVYKLEFKYE